MTETAPPKLFTRRKFLTGAAVVAADTALTLLTGCDVPATGVVEVSTEMGRLDEICQRTVGRGNDEVKLIPLSEQTFNTITAERLNGSYFDKNIWVLGAPSLSEPSQIKEVLNKDAQYPFRGYPVARIETVMHDETTNHGEVVYLAYRSKDNNLDIKTKSEFLFICLENQGHPNFVRVTDENEVRRIMAELNPSPPPLAGPVQKPNEIKEVTPSQEAVNRVLEQLIAAEIRNKTGKIAEVTVGEEKGTFRTSLIGNAVRSSPIIPEEKEGFNFKRWLSGGTEFERMGKAVISYHKGTDEERDETWYVPTPLNMDLKSIEFICFSEDWRNKEGKIQRSEVYLR